MGYNIAYAIEHLLQMAAQHRWIMLGALMGLIVVVLYNVIKRQY